MFGMILSKAAPHNKLAQLLRRKTLQFDLQLLPNTQQYRGIPYWEDMYYSTKKYRAVKDRDALVKCVKKLSVENLLYIKVSPRVVIFMSNFLLLSNP